MKSTVFLVLLVTIITTKEVNIQIDSTSNSIATNMLTRYKGKIKFDDKDNYLKLKGICGDCKISALTGKTECTGICHKQIMELRDFVLEVLIPNLSKVIQMNKSSLTIYGNGKWIRLVKGDGR